MSEKEAIYEVLHKAVMEAIEKVGLEAFKKTSLFMSNNRKIAPSP